MTRSRSSPGVPTRKIKPLRDADQCLLSPTPALERITDLSQDVKLIPKSARLGLSADLCAEPNLTHF